MKKPDLVPETRRESLTIEITDAVEYLGDLLERARKVRGGAMVANRLRDAWNQLLHAMEKSEELDADHAEEDAGELAYNSIDDQRTGVI